MLTVKEAKQFISPLAGLECWHVGRSYGSMFVMDFGEKVPYDSIKYGKCYKGSWDWLLNSHRGF